MTAQLIAEHTVANALRYGYVLISFAAIVRTVMELQDNILIHKIQFAVAIYLQGRS